MLKACDYRDPNQVSEASAHSWSAGVLPEGAGQASGFSPNLQSYRLKVGSESRGHLSQRFLSPHVPTSDHLVPVAASSFRASFVLFSYGEVHAPLRQLSAGLFLALVHFF